MLTAIDQVLGHELGHRELEGLIARRELAVAIDLLGLVLADVRSAKPEAGIPVLEGDSLHGAGERIPVSGQRLGDSLDPARRHQGRQVPWAQLLPNEAGRFALGRRETARRQVEVVEHEHDRATGRTRACRWGRPRRGPGGRAARGG
jgi:hypothetical protein